MNKIAPVLVIGAGSIGERHIGNLIKLGFTNIVVYRQRNLPFRFVNPEKVKVETDWEAVKKYLFQFAIICTPTDQHLQQTIDCIALDIHVLVEKPLSHTTVGIERLKAAVQVHNKIVHVAYMMQFHPQLTRVEQIISEGTYGKLMAISTNWGSYLPDWHPYEDYKTSYASQKIMGGGAALTLSHDIEVANRLSGGTLVSSSKHFGYTSALQIDTESVADFHLNYSNGVIAHVHLNYLEQIPRRNYTFLFENGTILIDYFAGTMQTINKLVNETHHLKNFDRNDMFISELVYFIKLTASTDCVTHSLDQINKSAVIIKLCNND